jgi:prepilin-type N-terminal cleavage/methylation domain-containing protein
MSRRAFTLVEMLIVVLIVGILAAVVVPRFVGVSDSARTASLDAALGSARAAISSFRATRAMSGAGVFPTAAELAEAGTVLQEGVPRNPFTNVAGVQSVSLTQAESRAVLNPEAYGWNYFVDNTATPPVAVFYANSDALTTREVGGDPQRANEL